MVSMALLSIIYISFISLGLPDSLLGSAWPAMSTALFAPLWGAGLVQMLISFCTIVSSLNSARLIRRFGTGRLTAASVTMTALALLGFSLARHYAWLLIMAIPLGLGAGAVDAALNNYVALHCQARHMSWLHCFWGVGTIVGPMVLSACLSMGWGWPAGYRTIGLMQCAVCALLFATLSLWKQEQMHDEEQGANVLSVSQVLALPGAKQGMGTFLCYCAVESTLGLWGATYMSVVRGVSEAAAASCGALFYLGITIGRAISGFMAMRLLPRQMVRIGQGLLIAGCVLMMIPAGSALSIAGLLLCGLGCAPIYPNILQDTPVNYGAANSQAAIGVQMAFAYVGSTFTPSVFGALAGIGGYAWMPFFALILAVLMIALFTAQKRIVQARRKDPRTKAWFA
ncbi:MAG TPA: MFS transporter [Candidatus Ventricola intestinavium]|nr:MFS transporter [Candidatus Ventricola intestinavium]